MKGQAPCGTPGIGVHRELVKFDLIMYYTVHRQSIDLDSDNFGIVDYRRSETLDVRNVAVREHILERQDEHGDSDREPGCRRYG